MSDLRDDWGRWRAAMEEQRRSWIEAILGGALDQAQYAAHCARVDTVKIALDLAQSVRRGDDIRERQSDDPPVNVEER